MTQMTKSELNTRQRHTRLVKLTAEAQRIVVIVILFAIGTVMARKFIGDYAVDWIVIASHFVAPYVHSASRAIEG